MQQKVADLRADLVGRGGNLALAISELAALFLQRFGPGGIAIAPQLTDLFGQTIDLSPQIVTLCRDLTALFVEFSNLSEVAQGAFVATTGERGADSVIVRTDSAYIDHGSEP